MQYLVGYNWDLLLLPSYLYFLPCLCQWVAKLVACDLEVPYSEHASTQCAMPLQVMITSINTKFQCVFVCWVAWYPPASLLPWFCFCACLLFAQMISCCGGLCILHFDWLVVWLLVRLSACVFLCWFCICLLVGSFGESVGELRGYKLGCLFCSLPIFAWLFGYWSHLVTIFFRFIRWSVCLSFLVYLEPQPVPKWTGVLRAFESPLRMFGHSMTWEIMIAASDQGRVQVLHNEPRQK